MKGLVGIATADSTGRIRVYIDDITNESIANERTWYDGLQVENVTSNPYPAKFWDGLIDEVRIYSFAMDQQTVQLLYDDKSCYRTEPYDLNADCLVNLTDLALFAGDWLDSGRDPQTQVCTANPALDRTGPLGVPDCEVNLFEYADLAAQWLGCYLLPVSDCP
jgi:hypothetical protein